MPIAIVTLFALAVFVSALDQNFVFDDNSYKIEVQVYNGWNLLTYFNPDYIAEESVIKKSDISAVFLYSPDLNKYIETYPNFNLPNSGLDSNDEYYDDASGFYAQWVYVNRPSETLIYEIPWYQGIYESSLSEGIINMKKGWNFIGINPAFMGKTIEEVKGNCEIQKVAIWMNNEQDWDVQSSSAIQTRDFQNWLLGEGIIIKVADTCTLGGSSSLINPPVIPEDDGSSEEATQEMCVETDNGKDIINKGVTEKGVTNGRDVCTIKQIDGSDITTTNCTGEDCFIIEFYCQENKVSYDKISCLNGCSNGRCLN